MGEGKITPPFDGENYAIIITGAKIGLIMIFIRAGEPETEPETEPKQHDLAGAIYVFLQEPEREPEPEHFQKLEWSWNWSLSRHKLVRFQAPVVFKIL